MSKMGLHDSFGHLRHKLWPKERLGVKLAIWLLTTKIRESIWIPCVQMACHIPSENCRRGLQLCFRSHLNRRSAHKVMGPQSSQSCGSPGTKCHLDVGLVKRHKVYYKGEGGGFPQVQAVMNFVSLVSLSLPVARPSTQKCSNDALTNLLFSLCKSMRMIKCLSFILVSSWSFSTSFIPKCCELGSMPQLFTFSLFSLQTHLESIKELGSTSVVHFLDHNAHFCKVPFLWILITNNKIYQIENLKLTIY